MKTKKAQRFASLLAGAKIRPTDQQRWFYPETGRTRWGAVDHCYVGTRVIKGYGGNFRRPIAHMKGMKP